MSALLLRQPWLFGKALGVIEPGHRRFIPRGPAIARIVQRYFQLQHQEIVGKIARGQYRISLDHWTEPMTETLLPHVAAHWRAGEIEAETRLRRQGVKGGPERRGATGEEAFTVTAKGRGSVASFHGRDAEAISAGRGTAFDSNTYFRKDRSSDFPIEVLTPDGEDIFEVFRPEVLQHIQQWTFAFADSTNQTSRLRTEDAIEELRRQLSEGAERGEALEQLTRRVNGIYQDRTRAQSIAATESSRFMHAGQLQAARESGVVVGKRWLASSDACPLCLALNGKVAGLDEPFVVDGKGVYAAVLYPPRH